MGRATEVSGLCDITSKWQLRTRINLSRPLWILFLTLVVSISPNACSGAFLARSKTELKSAVNACIKVFPKGSCSHILHGPIGNWDVSKVTDMSYMFSNARFFSTDISKWDVSNVGDMSGMFRGANSFNGDISKWDVSRVSKMDNMFGGASLFSRKLCGAAWVHSKARKTDMFAGSSGSISRTVCTTTTSGFSPEDKKELKDAVKEYLKLSSDGDWPGAPHGPIGEWDVSSVTDMSGMFFGAKEFNADISKWDVSRVTDMNKMFANAHSFNGDISKWSVSKVDDMSSMFYDAKKFDGDISKWVVSKVTDMGVMFAGAHSFNGDISKWTLWRVTDMGSMFLDAKVFKGDISKWDVSGVANMGAMFAGAHAFNGDISKWTVSRVTNMGSMFYNAKAFNADISKWRVSHVTSMSEMFAGAQSFNVDISKWDVSSVKNMLKMFYLATSFKRNLCETAWLDSNANKEEMFVGSPGSIQNTVCAPPPAFSPQSKDELKGAVDEYLKLSPTGESADSPHGPIGEWDVSSITNMNGMFFDAKEFNGDISKWDVSRVTDMNGMFMNAKEFNGDISNWDVSRVTNTNKMFYEAKAFDGDISKWAVSSVTDMSHMFFDARVFNGDISKWDVSRVTVMRAMFTGAHLFNGDMSKWDVSSVIDMDGMFFDAEAFNGDISKWDVSRVTDMGTMFAGAHAFNVDLSKWDVSKVTDMTSMFYGVLAFDADISKWDVSRVQSMRNMFRDAAAFNGDISKWDVSSVQTMDLMFLDATSFKQKLCGAAWINSKATKRETFAGSSGSISQTECSPAPESATRRPEPERELIARTSIAKTMMCSKCGTFKKSGRNSCCAPGGAWYKNCGGAHNKNVDHKWFEGVATCKRTTSTATPVSACTRCGTIGKSGKNSCCGRGGSWFKTCGRAGNTKHQRTWYEGIQACKARSQSKTAVGQQLNAAQQEGIDSSQGATTSVNLSTEGTTSIVTSTFTPDNVPIITSAHTLMTNTQTDALMTSPTHSSDSTSITTRGCANLLTIIARIILLFVIAF